MIAQMFSLGSLHAPRRSAGPGTKVKPLTREQALEGWVDAVANHVGDYPRIRAARIAFEQIAGKRDLGEMCGDLVRVVRDEQPVRLAPQPAPEREGSHRFHVLHEPKAPKVRKWPKKNEVKAAGNVKIGARVRLARKSAGFPTMKAFARAKRFPHGTLNRVENGYAPMTPAMVSRLAPLLGVSEEWLLTGKRQPKKGGAK